MSDNPWRRYHEDKRKRGESDREFCERIDAQDRERWKGKLDKARDPDAIMWPHVGALGAHRRASPVARLELDFWELHEIYTALCVDIRRLDVDEHEGCYAGFARLPPGWCLACDKGRP